MISMDGYIPSVTPGAIIGYNKHDRPIRLIGGGAPDDDEGSGADGGQGTGAGGSQAGNQDGGSTGTGGQGDGGTGTGQGAAQGSNGAAGGDGAQHSRAIDAVRSDFKAERAKRQKLEKDLADLQAANTRRAAAETERNRKLAIALGVAPDEPPDPEKLAAELAAERKAKQDAIDRSTARERELTVELQLLRQASRHGANPELLADSRSFMATLAGLDPSSEDFASDLGDAIKKAVEANPAYKITAPGGPAADGQNAGGGGGAGSGSDGKKAAGSKTTAPPARSGSDSGHQAAPGGNRQWTDEDVEKASPAELADAVDAGLLTGMGYHPRKKRRGQP